MHTRTEATRVISTLMAGILVAAGALSAQATRTPVESQKRPAERGEDRRESRESDESDEHTIAAARVPAVVRNAVTQAYPSARVTKWSREVEHGKTIYEAETVDGTTHRDMLIGTDGVITVVETQVTLDQIPPPIRAVATANNARIEKSEIVVAGRDTIYEFKIRGRGELKLRPNGTVVPAQP